MFIAGQRSFTNQLCIKQLRDKDVSSFLHVSIYRYKYIYICKNAMQGDTDDGVHYSIYNMTQIQVDFLSLSLSINIFYIWYMLIIINNVIRLILNKKKCLVWST